ncbi:MAG: glycoside hydrolase family 5 protein [Sedimentisphaerales bacterium]
MRPIKWMSRVEEIVDWGLKRDLFIIINAHHENWLKENYANSALRDRFDSIWRQISQRFKDKSGKLIFEIINEPNGLTKPEVNNLNERILKIIRQTNPTRLVIYSGNEWSTPDKLIQAAVPKDDYLIGTFHLYEPAAFTYEKKTTKWGTQAEKDAIKSDFDKVAKWSKENNIPVLLGEFGALTSGERESRIAFYTTYVEQALSRGFAFCVWDDGGNMEVYKRKTRDWNEIKDVLINTSAHSIDY